MSLLIESFESETLQKMIENKKSFLKNVRNKASYQLYQKEIIFLENEILPIVQTATNIEHREVVNYFLKAYNEATKPIYHFDGMIMYLPFNSENQFPDNIAVLNEGETKDFGFKGCSTINLELKNLNGSYIHPTLVPLNFLI